MRLRLHFKAAAVLSVRPLIQHHHKRSSNDLFCAHHQAQDLVIYVQHESADPEIPFFIPGTPEVAIHSVVAPLEQETVVVKNFPNSFRETGLKAILDEQSIGEVVIIGAMSHMCIDATSRAASDFGYKTTILHDACATLDLEFEGATVPASQVHATIMAALAFAYGTVITTDQYVK